MGEAKKGRGLAGSAAREACPTAVLVEGADVIWQPGAGCAGGAGLARSAAAAARARRGGPPAGGLAAAARALAPGGRGRQRLGSIGGDEGRRLEGHAVDHLSWRAARVAARVDAVRAGPARAPLLPPALQAARLGARPLPHVRNPAPKLARRSVTHLDEARRVQTVSRVVLPDGRAPHGCGAAGGRQRSARVLCSSACSRAGSGAQACRAAPMPERPRRSTQGPPELGRVVASRSSVPRPSPSSLAAALPSPPELAPSVDGSCSKVQLV